MTGSMVRMVLAAAAFYLAGAAQAVPPPGALPGAKLPAARAAAVLGSTRTAPPAGALTAGVGADLDLAALDVRGATVSAEDTRLFVGTVTVTAKIGNRGTAPSVPTKVRFWLKYGAAPDPAKPELTESVELDVPALNPGTFAEASFSKNLTMPASYGLKTLVDSPNKMAEANEVDNEDLRYICVVGRYPDLRADISLDPPGLEKTFIWYPTKFLLTVENVGTVASPPCSGRVDFGEGGPADFGIPALKPRESFKCSKDHRYGTIGTRHPKVVADYNLKIPDNDRTNNADTCRVKAGVK